MDDSRRTPRLLDWWLHHPRRVTGLAISYSVVLAVLSEYLSIARSFTHGGMRYSGFLTGTWIWVMILAVAAAYLFPIIVRQAERAIRSLDRILQPLETTTPPLSKKLGEGNRLYLDLTLFALAAVGTLAADWRDILSPLGWFDTSGDRDWTTASLILNKAPRGVYLVFNILVFALQTFCIFAALRLSAVVWPIMKALVMDTVETQPDRLLHRYRLVWDFHDPSGRCGLLEWDKLFVGLVTSLTLALNMALYLNLGRTGDVDFGVYAILGLVVVKAGILLLYLLIPFWSGFPSDVPDSIRPGGYKPVPWPAVPIVGALLTAVPDVSSIATILALLGQHREPWL